MWPTFYIPGNDAGGGPPPPPGDSQCYQLYTKLVDTTRNSGDGIAIDPELQFTTTALKAYWMYGRLRVIQTNAAGEPGFQCNFSHAGDTAAFQHLGQRTTSFVPTAGVITTHAWDPIDESRMADSNQIASTTVTTDRVLHVIIEGILVVGASGGLFGITWGLSDLTAGGSTKLLADSDIRVLELSAP